MLEVGVLALQGDVAEHIEAARRAAEKKKIQIRLRTVRTAAELQGLQAILLPGGESTTLSLLLQKEGMLEPMKEIPALLGTCAGLILMAKHVEGKGPDQEGLELMDVQVDRNAYGSQVDSFESPLEMTGQMDLGKTRIPFIRAPKITRVGEGVAVLAKHPTTGEPVVVEQKLPGKYYLGAACHPEMVSSKMHEYFLEQMQAALKSG
ncbi:Pyridoxal 5'-phosphate synthase subunit PdxT [uncultured archaeon]|nr:Pyridoxal 5'-phosphate synthase subunit PdxT [uncultured archaeon]